MDKRAIIKALRDTAQSASNSVASNVSGPVDLIAAALRMGGLPINKPMGGSEWMAEKGLTRDVEMGVPRIVGETLGMAGPIVAAAKAPQIAGAINRGMDNLAAPTAMNKQAGKVFIYPQDKALATAQANAAKPVSEGGLGLPANNTPAQRAQAMGFTDDVYHGTNSDVRAFGRVDGGNMWGNAHYTTNNTEDASKYATGWHNRMTPAGDAGANVMPLQAKGNLFDMDALVSKKEIDKLSKLSGIKLKDYLFDSKGVNVRQALAEQTIEGPNHWLQLAKYDGIKGAGSKTPAGGAGDIQATFKPENLRSRFAAFDPARRNEADILGRADPRLLGLIGIGAGGAGAYNYMQGQK